MRTVTILTAAALLAWVAPATAQNPEFLRKAVLITTTPPLPPGAPRSPQAVIDRLASFDANKDHRIIRDELPERMQGLIARGDKNADAALDAEEIRAVVNAASSERFRFSFHPQPVEGLLGVINDLKLPREKRERALAIVGDQRPTPRGNPPADGDLYQAMRSLLDDEDYENFVAAATRLSKTAQVKMGNFDGVGRRFPPSDGR